MVYTIDKLPGLHALRVIAAVSVYIGHCIFWSAHWLPLNGATTSVASNVTIGLQLFYVVSAFSLMYSMRVHDLTPDWTKNFYIRRFWRIAPLFYVMMVVDGIITYFREDRTPSVVEVIVNALFVNNLTPQYTSSMVYTGWSVSVEMLFYSIFPLVFIHIRTLNRGIIFAVVTTIVSQASRLYLDTIPQPLNSTYGDWSVIVQMQYFAFGTLAYLVYERLKQGGFATPAPMVKTALRHAVFIAPLAAIVAISALYKDEMVAMRRIDLTLIGIGFGVLTVWFSVLRIPALNWGPIQYFGERSYSLYLLHTPVIFMMQPLIIQMFQWFERGIGAWAIIPVLIIVYVPIMIVSMITYAWIERTGMDVGRRLRSKRPARDEPLPVVSQP